MRSGILYATAIIILVFVRCLRSPASRPPIRAAQASYIISILASLVVSITLTPVMVT